MTAYVASVGRTSALAKSGVMLRNDATSGSVFADVVVTPGGGVLYQSRPRAGGACVSAQIDGLKQNAAGAVTAQR